MTTRISSVVSPPNQRATLEDRRWRKALRFAAVASRQGDPLDIRYWDEPEWELVAEHLDTYRPSQYTRTLAVEIVEAMTS